MVDIDAARMSSRAGAESVEPSLDGLVEPVHWGSRLRRTPTRRYTEVSGTPLLVRPDDGDVQVLTPAWAAIWAALDGRAVTESLGVDPAQLNHVDGRNLLEVLRRLKATGVIVDAEPGTPRPLPDSDLTHQATTDGPVDVVFRGVMEHVDDQRMLRLDPSTPGTVPVRFTSSPDGVMLSTRRRLRRHRIDRVEVSDTARARSNAREAVDRFVTIIRCVADRDVLVSPAVVDVLAELAERADAPGSPVR